MEYYRQRAQSCEDYANDLLLRMSNMDGWQQQKIDMHIHQLNWTREKQSFYGFLACAEDPDFVGNLYAWSNNIRDQWKDMPEHAIEHFFGNDWTHFRNLRHMLLLEEGNEDLEALQDIEIYQ